MNKKSGGNPNMYPEHASRVGGSSYRGGAFVDPPTAYDGEATGSAVVGGSRNSPPLNFPVRSEHTMGGDSYGMSDRDMRQGHRKLKMPAARPNSPDMPVHDESDY